MCVVNAGALVLYLEHRYYGLSVPHNDLSTENLKYLSVQQGYARRRRQGCAVF